MTVGSAELGSGAARFRGAHVSPRSAAHILSPDVASRNTPGLTNANAEANAAAVVITPELNYHWTVRMIRGKESSMLEKSITSYKDLQFAPLGEGNPVEAALLWGDPGTGPVAFLVRMPEGCSEPWHSHTSTYRAVLIEGQFNEAFEPLAQA